MIQILSISTNEIEGTITRHADIIISNGQEAYLWGVGGLPVEGDVLTMLEAREAELWTAAAAAGRAVLPEHRAKIDFRNLPGWATWTGAEAAEALRTGILAGMTKAEARAAIAAQVAAAPQNLTGLVTALVQIVNTLSDAVIDGRDLGHQNEARAVMFLRDIAIR